MFRRLLTIALLFVLTSCACLLPGLAHAAADDKDKSPTAEQIVESVIFVYGRREGLQQIRRNGIERGRMTRIAEDGRTEESSYERRFVRGENVEKDRVRLDQKMPTMEFSLIYGGGHTFGILNGTTFTPRQEATTGFLSQMWHGVDSLLRYKENGSTLTLIGKDKQKGLDLYVLDLTDKDKRHTRFYISTKTLHILWLEYEEPATDGGKPVKFMKKFADYRYAQGTLVPYRTLVYEDGKQTQETRILTVTYGVKMEDSLFQNPEAQTSASQP